MITVEVDIDQLSQSAETFSEEPPIPIFKTDFEIVEAQLLFGRQVIRADT